MNWMPLRSRASRSARLGLAVVFAALALPLLPTAVGAASPTLALSVHVGYRDVVRSGQWMPVTIDVTNRGSDFQGTIDVQLQNSPPSQFSFQTAGAVYQLPFSLAAGAVKHVRTFVLSDIQGTPITVRLVTGGRVAATQAASGSTTANLLIGVLSDDPTAFDEFGAVHFPANTTPQVVHLSPSEVPDSSIVLRGFDLLAIDDFATDSLTPSQRNAITGYVAMGGSLLLGSGSSWHKTLSALPPALQPLTVDATTVLPKAAALGGGGPIEIATGRSNGGHAWLSDGSAPLLIEKPLGTGLVTLATFDWGQDPIASWSGARDLLRQVGVRSRFGSQAGSAPGIGGAGPFNIYTGGQGGSSLTQRGSLFIQALSNVPSLDLPSLQLTGLIVLLYVLLVGPINYLVLRRIGRRELAWLTVPALALVFASGAYGIALSTKGGSVQGTQIAIVHLTDGWDQAYQETYTGIFTPTRGDYAVSILGTHPAIAPVATVYGNNGPIDAGTRVHPDEGSLDLLGVTAFTLRAFATESTVPSAGLTASLVLRQGRLTGQVRNTSTTAFSDAVVIAGDGVERLGSLPAGGVSTIDVAVRPASPFQPGAVFRVYPNNMFGGPSAGQSSAAEREGEQRTYILQSLVGGFKGQAPVSISPMLVAWTQDPLVRLTVNGVPPRLQAESAIVVPLTVAQIGPGPLPTGMVSGRLVDATGNVQFGPSAVSLSDGSVTYELTARIGSGAHLANMAITSTNPFFQQLYNAPAIQGGAGAAGATVTTPPQAVLQSEVWNWAAGQWQPLTVQNNASTPLPDACLDPATGTVRIRLTAGPGTVPAQMGTLSLTGAVQ
jgi:hypothetical protein